MASLVPLVFPPFPSSCCCFSSPLFSFVFGQLLDKVMIPWLPITISYFCDKQSDRGRQVWYSTSAHGGGLNVLPLVCYQSCSFSVYFHVSIVWSWTWHPDGVVRSYPCISQSGCVRCCWNLFVLIEVWIIVADSERELRISVCGLPEFWQKADSEEGSLEYAFVGWQNFESK